MFWGLGQACSGFGFMRFWGVGFRVEGSGFKEFGLNP